MLNQDGQDWDVKPRTQRYAGKGQSWSSCGAPLRPSLRLDSL